MRYPEILTPIQLKHLKTGTPIVELDPTAPPPAPGAEPAIRIAKALTMAEWATEYPLNDAVFNAGAKEWAAANKIQNRLEAAVKEGKPFAEIEDSDWELLAMALNKPAVPGFGIVAGYARQFLPFVKSVLEAPQEAPTA